MKSLPGFRDFYPQPLPHAEAWSLDFRQHLFTQWRLVARGYGFSEYDGPPLEPLDLYTIKSGDEIVGQLYSFVDKGNRAVSLRPEMTPTMIRMAAAHERNYRKPIKWFSLPQLFRYEREQKGRKREHFQFNADILGEPDPAADAEIIALLIDLLRVLGRVSDDFIVRLSSRKAWHDFFLKHQADATREYEFYQVIDKLEREDAAESEQQLQKLGFSLSQIRDFIAAATPTAELQMILENLAARGLSDYAKIDYGIIRGLAYYTGVVFEVFPQKGKYRAIAGGGRYDHLAGLLTNNRVQLAAVGFGLGDVVVTEWLTESGYSPDVRQRPDIFFLIEEESMRSAALRQIALLRSGALSVDYCLTPVKPEKQFKRAVEMGARVTVRLERAAGISFRARIKNLTNRQETTCPVDQLLDTLRQGILQKPLS